MILAFPISVQDILDGKISPEDILETKEHISSQGGRMNYKWCAETYRDTDLQIIRCRGCQEYYDWHEMHLEGRGRYRNTCPDCYAKVYAKTATDGLSSKERQQLLGKELYGGENWAYMILSRGSVLNKPNEKHIITYYYFGSTENIISRLYQHQTHSSNPGVRDMFEMMESTAQWGYLSSVVTFQVWGFDTLDEAKAKEQSLYDFWKNKELESNNTPHQIIVQNKVRPEGVTDAKS